MCDKPLRDIAMSSGREPRSWREGDQFNISGHAIQAYLLQQICGQHQNIRILLEGFGSSKIPDGLEVYSRSRHDFDNMEGCPAHVIAEHVQLVGNVGR